MSIRITKRAPRRTALALALAMGLGVVGAASAQETAGSIYGSAPAQAGQTIQVTSDRGINRTLEIAADGTFSTSTLPAGVYTVTLMEDGAPVSEREVTIIAGAGTQVFFAGGATQLGTINVSANAMPTIDVTQPAAAFVVTAQELQKLPVGHSAEAIALLAPGVTSASGYFGNVVTFAGAGATENAYYVNGWNTTSLYDYTGASYQLPYGAIAQQQTIVGGYDARYGRTTGGVLAQIGARGTNEWHGGVSFRWSPRSLEAEHENIYYPQIDLQPGEEFADATTSPGDLRTFNQYDNSWGTETAAYISGPIVEDKLFFHISAQMEADKFRNVTSIASQEDQFTKNHQTKWYGKLDWVINDNNILEYTRLQLDGKYGYGETYRFNYDDKTSGEFLGKPSYLKFHHTTDIFHYTGYLTDKATVSILYGKSDVRNPIIIGTPSDLARIVGATDQDPDLNGGDPRVNGQINGTIASPSRRSGSTGLRVDFSYVLGDHTLEAGIDNLKYEAHDQGRLYSGPGYIWVYGHTDPDANINTTLGVGAPGGEGYYVSKTIFSSVTAMSAIQNAWYIQDKWQITDNLLLQAGIRNDDFENLNADGDAFVTQEDQWAPRFGFTWDVYGDSSFKVFGTLGRYNLAIPQATGERAAGSSYNTDEYFTYTGIDENGIPTGLTPVPGLDGGGPPGEVSANGEFGQAVNPNTVTSTSLKPQYQDELILGFDKTLGQDWVYGSKFTYRTLGTAIDDMCDPRGIPQGLEAAGYDPDNYLPLSPYCRIMNPNRDNTYLVEGKGDRDPVLITVTQEMMNFPDLQRDYYALSFYLEHPFADNWFGRFSYTFARSWGNAEGQVRSDIGQTDVAVTEDWDYWELMSSARGYLANHRRHQLKGYAAWQLTPEWLVSGTLDIKSGMPQSCLGWYGPDQTNPGGGYGTDAHWCRGEPAPPGGEVSGGMNPWTYTLNLGVVYAPSFADQRLKFKLSIFNALDSQETLQTLPHLYPRYSRKIDNQYHQVAFRQPARSVALSVSYDF